MCKGVLHDKDAFTMHIMLRSGKGYTATSKWRHPYCSDKKEGTIGILKAIDSIFASEAVSTSFMKKLDASLKDLDVSELPDGIFSSELRRNIMSSLNDDLNEDEKKKVTGELYDLLDTLNSERKYSNFINLLWVLVCLKGV